MTGIAAAGVIMRKTHVMEQAISERHLPWTLERRKWDRRDRLLVGVGLRRRGLRNGPPRSGKREDDQDQMNYAATGSGGYHRQSEAMVRGRHGQFTIQ